MAKKCLDPLDQQILACIPQGEVVTYRFIIDAVRTEKTPNGVRYHIDRLVRQGRLNADRILGRAVFYRLDYRTAEYPNTVVDRIKIVRRAPGGSTQQAPTCSTPHTSDRHAPITEAADE